MKLRRVFRWFLLILVLIIIIGYCLPQRFAMPVKGASKSSYDQRSFWYYPWGKSGTHKGVDIFARRGTGVTASTGGLVVFNGQLERGGNAVIVLGPKWRFHYYAHLDKSVVSRFDWVNPGELIGSVGTTGNAVGKSPHLHYSIASMLPMIWKVDDSKQGWKKMFYLNPVDYLNRADAAQ